ncbi:YqgQ family protein [Salisediminibacterium halotolerans]|uniref:YqgQ family protein n=1 Tax=Salisediminibacterium halotolerans TaxID=517425 RepID=UPI000F9F49AE|nr:YqgQ family protein [Salisediminibacterium halotolerans]RPE88554.1 uncharacterized protein YqgQ [Salisediminibacterium halotolerans]GEL06940.1 hypothetical protein SHA02_03560 [Salisediminibacterium halotolerans]
MLEALKPYHVFVYTGSAAGDLDLIHEEINELYRLGLISKEFYSEAKMTMQKRRQEQNINYK